MENDIVLTQNEKYELIKNITDPKIKTLEDLSHMFKDFSIKIQTEEQAIESSLSNSVNKKNNNSSYSEIPSNYEDKDPVQASDLPENSSSYTVSSDDMISSGIYDPQYVDEVLSDASGVNNNIKNHAKTRVLTNPSVPSIHEEVAENISSFPNPYGGSGIRTMSPGEFSQSGGRQIQ